MIMHALYFLEINLWLVLNWDEQFVDYELLSGVFIWILVENFKLVNFC